ncbi:hypothetical protein PIB30_042594 [Stylosanthes scabra]|uniref:Uncharacterized protein n=1 Tax=Stylosanthes scabra TaxID=79078 RepID=A0ABU6UE19_9FABA|nr:hypothetical protein [Stylosanthes scabra]
MLLVESKAAVGGDILSNTEGGVFLILSIDVDIVLVMLSTISVAWMQLMSKRGVHLTLQLRYPTKSRLRCRHSANLPANAPFYNIFAHYYPDLCWPLGIENGIGKRSQRRENRALCVTARLHRVTARVPESIMGVPLSASCELSHGSLVQLHVCLKTM